KPAAIFKAFHSIDTQHSLTQLGMQLVEHGFAETDGGVSDHSGHNTPDGVAVEPDSIDERNHLFRSSWIWAADDVVFGFSKIKRTEMRSAYIANLRHIGLN